MLIKRRKRGRGGVDSWEVVRARGHLDEVQELKSGEAALALAQGRPSKESMQLVLTEGAVLGGGAFSRVSIVTGCLLACLLVGGLLLQGNFVCQALIVWHAWSLLACLLAH